MRLGLYKKHIREVNYNIDNRCNLIGRCNFLSSIHVAMGECVAQLFASFYSSLCWEKFTHAENVNLYALKELSYVVNAFHDEPFTLESFLVHLNVKCQTHFI